MVQPKDKQFPADKTLENYATQYKEEARIAKGSYGTVHKVVSQTGEIYVAKKIQLTTLNEKEVS